MGFTCGETRFRNRLKAKMGRVATIGRTSIITKHHNGRAPCHYCGPCNHGCITYSYYSSPFTTLKTAAETGNLTLISDAPVSHITMLVSAPPQLAPSKLVQYVKGRSSRRLQEEFPHLRKRYWGQHLWARGYFCATVGAVDEATIKQYIENQKWDEDGEGFKITAPAEP